MECRMKLVYCGLVFLLNIVLLNSCNKNSTNKISSFWVSNQNSSIYFTENTITVLKLGNFVGEYLYKKNDSLLTLFLPFDTSIHFQVSYIERKDSITIYNDSTFIFGVDTIQFHKIILEDTNRFTSVLSHLSKSQPLNIDINGAWMSERRYIVLKENGHANIADIGVPICQSEFFRYVMKGNVVFFRKNKYRYYYSIVEPIDKSNINIEFNNYDLKYSVKYKFVRCTDSSLSNLGDTDTTKYCNYYPDSVNNQFEYGITECYCSKITLYFTFIDKVNKTTSKSIIADNGGSTTFMVVDEKGKMNEQKMLYYQNYIIFCYKNILGKRLEIYDIEKQKLVEIPDAYSLSSDNEIYFNAKNGLITLKFAERQSRDYNTKYYYFDKGKIKLDEVKKE